MTERSVAHTVVRTIDKVNLWVERGARFVLVPVVFLVCYEVVARYVFDHPTKWAWPIIAQLFVVIGLVSIGYTLKVGGHVSMDVLINTLSERKAAWLRLFTFALVLLGCVFLVWKGGELAWLSIQGRGRIHKSSNR